MLQQAVKQAPPRTQFSLRPQGSWTYEDWLNFPEDGWKYEIINGVLYMTPPPAVGHQRSSIGLATRMYSYVGKHDLGEVLTAPCGVRLPNQPVPVEPDIFFIKKDRLHIIGDQLVEGAPNLIVEILSPSNANYDRETKFKVYQEAGIPEYWLVDYQRKTVEVFSLSEGVYTLLGKYKVGDTVTSKELSGFKVPVKNIFNF
jgi:Uma2 family endonuclease